MFMLRSVPAICSGDKRSRSMWDTTRSARYPEELSLRSTNPAAGMYLLQGPRWPSSHHRHLDYVSTLNSQLSTDGRWRSVNQASDAAKTLALGLTELNGGALFNAEFFIKHRGSTVPDGSDVAAAPITWYRTRVFKK